MSPQYSKSPRTILVVDDDTSVVEVLHKILSKHGYEVLQAAGAEVSALKHVLGGNETVAVDRGVFLDTTQRMHPDVCEFISTAFYDGRLASDPSCARQRLSHQ